MSAWIAPRRTLRFTPSTATKPLNSLVRPRVSRMTSGGVPIVFGRECGRRCYRRAPSRGKPPDGKKHREIRDLGRACPASRTAGAARPGRPSRRCHNRGMSQPANAATAARVEPVLLRSDQDRVAVLTLNRPRQYNALSSALLEALHAELDR